MTHTNTHQASPQGPETLRQAIDLCNDEILDDIATALGSLEDALTADPDADPQPHLDQAIMVSHNAVTAGFRKLARWLRDGAPVPSRETAPPCDHRDALDYLAKAGDALATALEVDGQDAVDAESGALRSRALTRAWSAVRMARLELRGGAR